MPRGSGGGAAARKAAGKMLDELMGRDRNDPLGESTRRKEHFSDDEFCKLFLCGFCPRELFINTKADKGRCPAVHSEPMKRMWDSIGDLERARFRYEDDMQRELDDWVHSIESEILRRKEESRLQEGLIKPNPELAARAEGLEAKIAELTDEQDELYDEGRFDDAKAVVDKIERLRSELTATQTEIDGQMSALKMKVMEICEVCGAKLERGDESAMNKHLAGKQHIGYVKIRKTLKDLRAGKEKRQELRAQAKRSENDASAPDANANPPRRRDD